MTYAERLAVPPRWWVLATLLVASFWLAMVAAIPGSLAWALAGVAAAVAVTALGAYGAARVEVREGWFQAGRASLPAEFIGRVEVLDVEASRRAAGIESDARAYLLIRPYIRSCVRVEITDPADPTPYWLVSTRHPERLAEILTAVAVRPPTAGS